MKKTTLLAVILAAGVSGAAIAQTMDSTTGSSTTTTGDNSMGSTNSMGGAMNGSPGAGSQSSNNDTPGNTGPTRPNSAYGTKDPGLADTTPGVNQPTTTRNADSTETRAPLKGANSFTMNEASRRLERAGYTNVSGLAKDDQSVWRGMATNKNGQSVAVALDYRGNITDQPK